MVLIGSLITGLVTIGADLVRACTSSRQDAARRADDRRIERERFQRANLLEPQTDVVALVLW